MGIEYLDLKLQGLVHVLGDEQSARNKERDREVVPPVLICVFAL